MPEKSPKKSPGAKAGYWYESARPLAGLIFVAPMLIVYELGVMLLDHQAIRNAADVWLRQILDLLGFSQYFLLPILTCGSLLAWHHLKHQPWRLNWGVFYGMLLESLVFGFALVLVAGWQRSLFSAAVPVCAANSAGTSDLALMVGYLGAGIYEELLFRLILLSATMGLLRLSGLSVRWSAVTAVIVTSVLFSAAHYQIDLTFAGHHFATTYGEDFEWYSFCFRFLAGVYFSVLFVFRGFGIAAGTHATYDLFTLVF
jgi:membrane protease YdiL (CAAX protease family)